MNKKMNNFDLSFLEDKGEIARLREHFSLLFQNVRDGIIVQKGETVLYANNAAIELGSLTDKKKAIGVSLSKLMAGQRFLTEKGKRISLNDLPMSRVLGGRKELEGRFIKINKKTGENRWVQIQSVSAEDDKDGGVKIIISILRDITGQVLSEKIRNDFLNMISHELKTPITSIKALSQILEVKVKKIDNSNLEYYLDKMDRQVDNLAELVDEILGVAKLQEGEAYFKDKWFSFDLLMKRIAAQVENKTNHHKLIVSGSTRKDFYGDEDKIGKIFINLISNAVKYSPESKKVIIKLSSNRNFINVSVIDFGIGISARHYKNIFKKFYRVFGGEDKLFPGIGLGLYIAKEITEAYGGKIWVESNEGRGSRFFLSLPLKEKKNE